MTDTPATPLSALTTIDRIIGSEARLDTEACARIRAALEGAFAALYRPAPEGETTRYWYDFEFLEDGRMIDLISIGIVSEDGREYYAVAADAPWHRIARSDWLCQHVVPHLPLLLAPVRRGDQWGFTIDRKSPIVRPEQQIAAEVRAFLLGGVGRPELWAYYGAYDHVKLNQLWGPMAAHPEGVPMYSNDLMQAVRRLKVDPAELPAQASGEHNALADARHNRVMWAWLEEYAIEHTGLGL